MKPNLYLVFFFLALSSALPAQSRWYRTYFDGRDAWIRDLQLSYDNGYLLAGNIHDEGPIFSWIVKTDINGEVLWEKDLNNPSDLMGVFCMDQNSAGDIFVAGQTYGYGDTGDPVVVKLNACGEKEWCRAIVTEAEYDYAIDIVALDNGGCTFSLRNSTLSNYTDRVCLMSLDHDGNYLWKECYNGTDTNLRVIDHTSISATSGKGYIIAGECRYYGPLPNDQRSLAYFVKTDSLGLQQWDAVVEADTGNHNQGYGRNITISPDGQYYMASISRYHSGENFGLAPALVKISLSGEVLAIHDLAEPSTHGSLLDSRFLDDTTLAVTGIWEISGTDDYHLALTNDEGQILEIITDVGDVIEGDVGITSDKKIVLLACRSVNDLFQPVLYKFNDHLVDEPLNLEPIRYDSLCPYQILSGAFDLEDCDMILDAGKPPFKGQDPGGNIRVHPNPCNDHLRIEFRQAVPCRLDLYSSVGRLIFSKDIQKNTSELNIKTSAFPSGLLIAVLCYPDRSIETVKIFKIP